MQIYTVYLFIYDLTTESCDGITVRLFLIIQTNYFKISYKQQTMILLNTLFI